MAIATTFGTVVSQALDRADVPSSAVDSTRIREYVNAELSRLHNLLVNVREDFYRKVDTSISTSANTQEYTLPNDLLRVRKVFIQETSSPPTRRELQRLDISDLGTRGYGRKHYYSDNTGEPCGYLIAQDKLVLYPTPQGAETVELWYVPHFTPFATDNSEDANTLDSQIPPGWEELVVLGTAIRVLDREETDSSALRSMYVDLREELMRTASSRDDGGPKRVIDRSGRGFHRG
jgi:hypothetical protein